MFERYIQTSAAATFEIFELIILIYFIFEFINQSEITLIVMSLLVYFLIQFQFQ